MDIWTLTKEKKQIFLIHRNEHEEANKMIFKKPQMKHQKKNFRK